MEWLTLDCADRPATVNIARFCGTGGVEEIHLTVCPTQYAAIEVQLDWVQQAYRQALTQLGLTAQTALMRRLFCSDPVNQSGALEAALLANPRNTAEPCAVSWVGQAPVPDAKVALWAYHMRDPAGDLEKIQQGTSLTCHRGELTHHWTTGIVSPSGETSYDQTRDLFEQYQVFLEQRHLTLADHVIRTWLFVRNIDANYHGLVAARREFFARHGLTPDTHYIASSGIEGGSTHLDAQVAMDAYAIGGVRPDQIEYLAALDHLGPTYLYGVTFERATAVAYRDRRHVFISGTASIDPQGNILHPGDVVRQLDRTLENIESLLRQAGATLGDMGIFIVYLRDPSDHAVVRQIMRERAADAPVVIVVAPVCRPGWLIEVEGMAIIPADHPALPAF